MCVHMEKLWSFKIKYWDSFHYYIFSRQLVKVLQVTSTFFAFFTFISEEDKKDLWDFRSFESRFVVVGKKRTKGSLVKKSLHKF